MAETEKLEALGLYAAQQNAMQRSCRFLPHGGRLFAVESGWESAMIKKEEGTAQCGTLLTLEAALRDPDVRVIFLPLGARVADADIERLCHRNGAAKTLFREVEKKAS